jgi:hypothetical protein
MLRYDASWGNPYRGQVKHDAPKLFTLKDFLSAHGFGMLHDKLPGGRQGPSPGGLWRRFIYLRPLFP